MHGMILPVDEKEQTPGRNRVWNKYYCNRQ
jgi:hypothetical protein